MFIKLWLLFHDWYKSLPIVRKLRERRLISTTLIVSFLMILVAQLASTSSDHKTSHQIVINWCCGFLYFLFAFLVFLLLLASPTHCSFSTINLLVCLSLTLSELLIAGLSLNDDGAFLIRLIGYILISCLELISSTKFKEWTLFGLFISFGVDFISWIILIPLQEHELRAVNTTASLFHFFISVALALAVWVYMIRVPEIDGARVLQRDDNTGVGTKGFRYDDAIYSLSTAWNEFESGFEQHETSQRGGGGGGGAATGGGGSPSGPGDGRSTLSSYFGTQSVEEDDVEIMDLKLSEPTNHYVPRVMITLHTAVALLALLMGQGVLSSDVSHTILAVVVNSFLCLWQISKMFGSFLTCFEITSLKHDRHLLKAQKDALRTLNTLSAELKWPTSSIRGVSLPSSADKGNILQRTFRALLWAGHSTRMLEVGSEAMLNSLTKSSRIMSLRHVIVTFGTCLNCQSLSAVKDMHTSISVVVRQAGVPVSENSADTNISSTKPRDRDDSTAAIAVIGNHDLLLYGLLGLHSFIIKLADPHQEIRFEMELYVDKLLGKVQLTSSVTYWGERPTWSESATTRSRVIETKGSNDKETDMDALQTLVESIRDSLRATLVSVSQGRLCSTTFQFNLPIPGYPLSSPLALGEAETEATMWRPRSLKAPWILIVDDSAVSRKLVRRNIIKLIPDAEIEECSSSKAAMTSLARYSSEKFDYVLVDYVVNSEKRSIGAGVQLCTKMRQFAQHITIVGITGDNYGVALSDFLLNGADLAYMKPITPATLREIFFMHLLSPSSAPHTLTPAADMRKMPLSQEDQ